jgi:MinD-like ATPase involved in chromosome partitioning or flagellar assembly
MKSLLNSLSLSRPLLKPKRRAVGAAGTANTSRKDGFVFTFDREGRAASQYRAMRAEILNKKCERKLILVTSPGSGDGKTLTAVNLAFALEEKKLAVLVLELALTRPRFRYVFGKPPAASGVEAVLRGEASPEDVICQLGDTGVAAAAVNKTADHQLLTANRNLEKLLEYGERKYDWTILDAPDIGSYKGVKALASRAGSVVMVARSRQTHVDSFRDAVRILGEDLDFVILNDVRD